MHDGVSPDAVAAIRVACLPNDELDQGTRLPVAHDCSSPRNKKKAGVVWVQHLKVNQAGDRSRAASISGELKVHVPSVFIYALFLFCLILFSTVCQAWRVTGLRAKRGGGFQRRKAKHGTLIMSIEVPTFLSTQVIDRTNSVEVTTK